MTPLLFGYAEAQRISRELELDARRVTDSGISVKEAPFKERLGRTLIHWGELLVPSARPQQGGTERDARHAA